MGPHLLGSMPRSTGKLPAPRHRVHRISGERGTGRAAGPLGDDMVDDEVFAKQSSEYARPLRSTPAPTPWAGHKAKPLKQSNCGSTASTPRPKPRPSTTRRPPPQTSKPPPTANPHQPNNPSTPPATRSGNRPSRRWTGPAANWTARAGKPSARSTAPKSTPRRNPPSSTTSAKPPATCCTISG